MFIGLHKGQRPNGILGGLTRLIPAERSKA
jgi:hypothetical protein